MIGFGKSIKELPEKKIYAEIKTLNSKTFDINTRIPTLYREKDIELRNYLSSRLLRGKIDLIITLESAFPEKITKLNLLIIEDYFLQLSKISNKFNIENNTDFLRIILSLPDALTSEETQNLDEDEWITVMETVDLAIAEVEKFRLQEGKILEEDILKHGINIQNLLRQIEAFEYQRIDKIKKKIRESVEEFTGKTNFDENRFEQELIYYVEKIDFTEEKVRLENHIKYFFETLKESEAVGKKMGFIAQEMGREINTLGSKASDADIQKIVIQMKDELEKIKEQTLNIL
jgi:uncharacterized protein (TIGR00255 family)